MNVRYRVTLTSEERAQLQALVLGGKVLGSEAQARPDPARGGQWVERRRDRPQRLGRDLDGLSHQAALRRGGPRASAQRGAAAGRGAQARRERRGAPGRDGVLQPARGARTLDLALLADEMVRLTDHRSLSSETIRRRLAENELKPWQKKMWCIPKVDAEFVARMEDVLDLYAEPPDEQRPVVCFDETPRQLIGESRVPVAAKPGQPARFDYEYVRNGTANVFMFVDAHRPWRHAKVTDRRTSRDFAECMRDLVDVHYPKAERIRVVLDNLSTHTPAALYESLEPPRPAASCGDWNSTTRPSTRAG